MRNERANQERMRNQDSPHDEHDVAEQGNRGEKDQPQNVHREPSRLRTEDDEQQKSER